MHREIKLNDRIFYPPWGNIIHLMAIRIVIYEPLRGIYKVFEVLNCFS
jgi:hypothetical protein